MTPENLHELLVDELKDLYSAKTPDSRRPCPGWRRKPRTSRGLRTAFQSHLNQTEEHVNRLERVCDLLDAKPRGKKCKAMEGLIEEGKEAMEGGADPVLDAALIGAAQKVEHYEMAGYGTARTYAASGRRGSRQPAPADPRRRRRDRQILTRIAESHVNTEAVNNSAISHNGFSG